MPEPDTPAAPPTPDTRGEGRGDTREGEVPRRGADTSRGDTPGDDEAYPRADTPHGDTRGDTPGAAPGRRGADTPHGDTPEAAPAYRHADTSPWDTPGAAPARRSAAEPRRAAEPRCAAGPGTARRDTPGPVLPYERADTPRRAAVEPPVTDLSDLPPVSWAARIAAVRPALALSAALALWAYAVRHTDVSRLDDLGLVTALHPAFWAGLTVLTVGFWCTVRGGRRGDLWPAAYVLGLLVMERATQAVLYPTPLYAWAWKHDAVVGHLLTAGRLQGADRLGDMAVYDQWPGFFAAQAALVRLLGVQDAAMYMAWWPLASSVLLLLPLLLLYRTFTEDRRLIWTAVWLFCVANWVGQDYFSPQSVAFALHLGVLAVVLRRYARTGGHPARQGQALWTVLITVLVAAIVVSHQLTPAMLVVSLIALAVTRRHRDWTPSATALVVFLAWCLTAALPFLSAAMPELIRAVGDIGGNVEAGYGTTPTGTGALVSSWTARLLTASVLLLALAGAVRRKALRHRALPLLLLAAAPLPMFAAGSYGSEMIFRVLMFMLPGAAFFAAAALLPPVPAPAAAGTTAPRATPPRGARPALWVPLAALLAGTLAFVPSYSGKDRVSYFPPREVALVRQLFDQAPDGSLVVAANRNYPLALEAYWRTDHYWFLDDDRRHVDEILRDPATVLARDMAAVQPPARAYFLLTRGQMAHSAMNGPLDEPALRRVRDAVAASPRFAPVAENDAGVLYVLKPASREGDR
ncbi:glycosyltransferase [Streptomyces sp. AD55]|uniref:glycosyltransferase n=1 Tax=Streptomyces sp. AD55 TaxID=3242895 RepID=UPI003526EB58